MIQSVASRLRPARQAHDKRDQGANQENKEQDLGDTDRTGRDAGETEQRSNQRDDEEDDGVVRHKASRTVA